MDHSTPTKGELSMILEISNFGRIQLADLIHELDFKTGVEVGVAAGWYSSVLANANPQMKLYGVDPWTPYKGYRDYVRTSTLDTLEIKAHRALDKYPNYTFVKKFSMDAVGDFADGSLDFVYIDANHGDPYVTQDITEWYKKLRSGGILAGHDYVRTKSRDDQPLINDTKSATQLFAKANNLILFILGTDAIREGEVRDRPRSWMMIKK